MAETSLYKGRFLSPPPPPPSINKTELQSQQGVVSTAPSRSRKSPRQDDYEPPLASGKRPRTTEDFLLFCKFILDYENYEMLRHDVQQPVSCKELRSKANSPVGSTGSSEGTVSETPSSNCSGDGERQASDRDSDGSSDSSDGDSDGYMSVTCYCGKPFAGRPMIECGRCLTWIHLSCARIRKSNIPDDFICTKCRDKANSHSSSPSS